MGPVLDVAIGLILLYLVLSLIASAAAELVESVLRRRAKYLWLAVGELLGDPPRQARRSSECQKQGPSLEDFYHHPLICGLFYDSYKQAQRPLVLRRLPSYIPAGHFATAVIDLVARRPPTRTSRPLQRCGRA